MDLPYRTYTIPKGWCSLKSTTRIVLLHIPIAVRLRAASPISISLHFGLWVSRPCIHLNRVRTNYICDFANVQVGSTQFPIFLPTTRPSSCNVSWRSRGHRLLPHCQGYYVLRHHRSDPPSFCAARSNAWNR